MRSRLDTGGQGWEVGQVPAGLVVDDSVATWPLRSWDRRPPQGGRPPPLLFRLPPLMSRVISKGERVQTFGPPYPRRPLPLEGGSLRHSRVSGWWTKSGHPPLCVGEKTLVCPPTLVEQVEIRTSFRTFSEPTAGLPTTTTATPPEKGEIKNEGVGEGADDCPLSFTPSNVYSPQQDCIGSVSAQVWNSRAGTRSPPKVFSTKGCLERVGSGLTPWVPNPPPVPLLPS